jgi:hypothetical protein
MTSQFDLSVKKTPGKKAFFAECQKHLAKTLSAQCFSNTWQRSFCRRFFCECFFGTRQRASLLSARKKHSVNYLTLDKELVRRSVLILCLCLPVTTTTVLSMKNGWLAPISNRDG